MKNRDTYYVSSGKAVLVSVGVYDSSLIGSIEWNNHFQAAGLADGGELVVRFLSGTTYVYENVTLNQLWYVATADSVGKAYNERIKGKYEFRKLELSPVPA